MQVCNVHFFQYCKPKRVVGAGLLFLDKRNNCKTLTLSYSSAASPACATVSSGLIIAKSHGSGCKVIYD
jgi:hypothetical protein